MSQKFSGDGRLQSAVKISHVQQQASLVATVRQSAITSQTHAN